MQYAEGDAAFTYNTQPAFYLAHPVFRVETRYHL